MTKLGASTLGKRIAWSLVIMGFLAAPCFGQNQAIWNGGTGNFSQASNWSCIVPPNPQIINCVPGPTFNVNLGSFPATVNVDQNASVFSLTGGPGQSVTVSEKALNSLSTITISGLTLNQGTVFTQQGTLINGTFSATKSEVDGGLGINARGASTISDSTINSGGSFSGLVLDVRQGTTTISNSTINGGGNLIVQGGTTLNVTNSTLNSAFTNTTSGAVTVGGGSVLSSVQEWDVLNGTLTLNGSPTQLLLGGKGPAIVVTGATIDVQGGAQIVGAVDSALFVGSVQSGAAVPGTLNIGGPGTIVQVQNAQINYGTVTIDFGGKLVAEKTLNVGGPNGPAPPAPGTGDLRVETGQVSSGPAAIAGSPGSIGTVGIIDGGRWEVNGSLSVGAVGTGALTIHNGTVTSQSGIIGGGQGSVGLVKVEGALGSWTIGNASAGGNLQIGTLQGFGELTVRDLGKLTANTIEVGAHGKLDGVGGQIFGKIKVDAGGLVVPGDPGVMNIIGSFDLSPGATLMLDIASATDYDSLNITGDGIFNGTIDLDFLNGFAPSAGDSFRFITDTGGTFTWHPSSINFIGLTPGAFTTDFSSGFFLTATNNWGSGSPPAATTPEADSWVLLGIGLLALAWLRRKKAIVKPRMPPSAGLLTVPGY